MKKTVIVLIKCTCGKTIRRTLCSNDVKRIRRGLSKTKPRTLVLTPEEGDEEVK